MPMYIRKNKSRIQTIKAILDYGLNEKKTNNGLDISSYMCDPKIAYKQWEITKKLYEQKTNRFQENEVIVYQIRQSFRPGEVTPEIANEIGYKLAEKLTKGKNAFVVATHTDTEHFHNHIYINSTNLDCRKKFRDFFKSGRAIGKMSDRLCLEYGLSIVENPSEKGKHYGKWLGDNRPSNAKERLIKNIDEVLSENPTDFEDFLLKMKERDYQIKRGKHLSFKENGAKKYKRLRSLGDNYLEDTLLEIINGNREHQPTNIMNKKNIIDVINKDKKMNLLVDLENAVIKQKGKGYEKWATGFNIKQLANTLNYLQENKLLNYDDLQVKSDEVSSEIKSLLDDIKIKESKMKEISNIQKNIIQFVKTKEVYEAYKKSGYSKKFKEENITEILLHQGAKKQFSELGFNGKLPKMADLKQEYATLLTDKKKAYSRYNEIKKEHKEIMIAKQNISLLLSEENETNKKKFNTRNR